MNDKDKREKVLNLTQIIVWIGIFVLVALFLAYYTEKNLKVLNITYSEFIQEVEKGNIKKVIVSEKELQGYFKNPKEVKGLNFTEFKLSLPMEKPDILDFLV
ncbi:MAG: ATP-dependent metallopeptidase FtsH/Yme1/Tma family protein, partial [candidate division WOR-3 bacterium]